MRLMRPEVQADVEYLKRRIAHGPGRSTADDRTAVIEDRYVGPLSAYLDKVRFAPTSITDAEVAALRSSGHSDDELFELTVAAALGASFERLETGLAAIAEAYTPHPQTQNHPQAQNQPQARHTLQPPPEPPLQLPSQPPPQPIEHFPSENLDA